MPTSLLDVICRTNVPALPVFVKVMEPLALLPTLVEAKPVGLIVGPDSFDMATLKLLLALLLRYPTVTVAPVATPVKVMSSELLCMF